MTGRRRGFCIPTLQQPESFSACPVWGLRCSWCDSSLSTEIGDSSGLAVRHSSPSRRSFCRWLHKACLLLSSSRHLQLRFQGSSSSCHLSHYPWSLPSPHSSTVALSCPSPTSSVTNRPCSWSCEIQHTRPYCLLHRQTARFDRSLLHPSWPRVSISSQIPPRSTPNCANPVLEAQSPDLPYLHSHILPEYLSMHLRTLPS